MTFLAKIDIYRQTSKPPYKPEPSKKVNVPSRPPSGFGPSTTEPLGFLELEHHCVGRFLEGVISETIKHYTCTNLRATNLRHLLHPISWSRKVSVDSYWRSRRRRRNFHRKTRGFQHCKGRNLILADYPLTRNYYENNSLRITFRNF